METWRRFWSLSAYSRGVVLEAAAALGVTWIALRLAGFRRWKGLLDRLGPEPVSYKNATDPALIGAAQAIARLEQAAARHVFFRSNCLEQSLVLCWLLQRRGISADLRVGARKQDGRFEAHAWVESGGMALNDTGEEHLHFVPFDGPIGSMETQIH